MGVYVARTLSEIALSEVLVTHSPDLGSITFKCNRLHYNYFTIFMITLHYDYINFQM
jgi:hypothetical protein